MKNITQIKLLVLMQLLELVATIPISLKYHKTK